MYNEKTVYGKARGCLDKKSQYLWSSYGNLVIEIMVIKGHV